MTIEEFLGKDHRFPFPTVPTGSSSTVGEFYQKAIITPKNTETVREWHRLLTRYMNDPEAIILSRLYENQKLNGKWDNRRGMMTRMADGFSYACASNYFARIVFTMAYCDFVPEYNDFKQMFTGRKFALSIMGATEIERKYGAFRNKQYAPRFYTPGWYLAHIVAYENDQYSGFPEIDLESIISLGEKDQWKNTGGYYVRELETTLSADQKKIAKAQFLRFIDPINYFLVPNKNNCSIGQIGENSEIVNYMRKKYFDIFSDDYRDFMKKALVAQNLIPQERIDELASQKIDVSFRENRPHHAAGRNTLTPKTHNTTQSLRRKPSGGTHHTRSRFTDHEKAICLKAYLFDNLSFRRLERDVLGMESEDRGGGFKAQTMMRSFGLDSSNKGMFEGKTLSSAINQSSGVIKSALEFIRDNQGD